MVASTLLGPILAVQAQKWVERARASSQRKDWIFTTLMGTRQARVSFEHVRALNMIDLAYYGSRVPIVGYVWQTNSEREVLTAWHTYHAHLTLPTVRRPANEGEQRDWVGRGDELFTNLMDRLALANKFRFERDQLKSGSYSPEAHSTAEMEAQAVRQLAIEVMMGQKALPMDLKAWPIDPEIAAQQRATQTELVANQRELFGQLAEIIRRLTDHAVGPNVEVAQAGPRQNEPAPDAPR
jgi:hypothetical protein